MAILNEEKEKKRRLASITRDIKYVIKSNRQDQWDEALNRASRSLLEEAHSPNHISDLAPFHFHSLPSKVYDYLEKDVPLEKELSILPQNIFISYAKEDAQKAEILYKYLYKRGHKPWMDKHNLLPGQDWEFEISKAFKKSDFVIVLLSNKSINKRGFVQNEMKMALNAARSIPEGRIFIIPVLLEPCEVPPSMDSLHYINFSSKEALIKILHAIEVEL